MELNILEGMTIQRVISHIVYARNSDKQVVPPKLNNELLPLEQDELDLLQIRTTSALISNAHGIETEIVNTGINSFFQLSVNMLDSDDKNFSVHSQQLAVNLTEAQTSTRWPGGVLVIFQGLIGEMGHRFLAIVKAETDKGFNMKEVNGKTTFELIKNMMLTQTQKLYKIGLLIEIKKPVPNEDISISNYRSFLFDHLLTAT